jgi:sulfate adenylyltransferase subunit 1
MLPVQYVARHGDGANPERVFWGRVAAGSVRAGDVVELVGATRQQARVTAVRRAGTEVAAAAAGESAGLVLDRPLDISRGDWLLAPGSVQPSADFSATLAWLDPEPAVVGRRYQVRHGHRWVAARITAIEHRLDIGTLAPAAADALGVNEIGRVRMQLQQPLPLAPYRNNAVAGALIVVDPQSHRTSGALLVDTPGAQV